MALNDINVNLSQITVNNSNPFVLFNEWYDDVKANGNLHFSSQQAMNVATVSKDGCVSNRTVLLQEMESDGFIFNTDKNGRKSKDIAEHPQISATIFWNYEKDGRYMQRQARIEGNATTLDNTYSQRQFDKAGLNHKVRSMLCKQSNVVEWPVMKKRLDNLLEDIKTNKTPIEMLDTLVAFKIIPDRMEFYHVYDNEIPDRVVFSKTNGVWSFVHTEP